MSNALATIRARPVVAAATLGLGFSLLLLLRSQRGRRRKQLTAPAAGSFSAYGRSDELTCSADSTARIRLAADGVGAAKPRTVNHICTISARSKHHDIP